MLECLHVISGHRSLLYCTIKKRMSYYTAQLKRECALQTSAPTAMSFSNFANVFISSSICFSAFSFSFAQASSAATWTSVEQHDRTNRECNRTHKSQKTKKWRRPQLVCMHACSCDMCKHVSLVVHLYARGCQYHLNNRGLKHVSNHIRCNKPTRNTHHFSQIVELSSQINNHASGDSSISVICQSEVLSEVFTLPHHFIISDAAQYSETLIGTVVR